MKHTFEVDDKGNVIVDDPCNYGHNYARCTKCGEVFDVCCDHMDEYLKLEDCAKQEKVKMKKFENMGFTTIVTNDKVKIEIPISGLVNSFKWHESNGDDAFKIKRGMRDQFAEWFAQQIISEEDPETGTSFIACAVDRVFDLIFEGYETPDFIRYEQDGEGL